MAETALSQPQTDYSQYINPVDAAMWQMQHNGINVGGVSNTTGTYDPLKDPAYQAAVQQRNGMIQQGLASGALNADQIDQLLKQGDIQSSQVGSDYWQSVAQRNKTELDRQQQQMVIDKQRGFDSNGRPIRPDYLGNTNADGTLKDQFKMADWQNVNPNQDALNKYSQTALRDPKQQSAWAQLMNDQINAQTSQNMDNASQMGANNQLAAEDQLAQSGGLSGAARERLATQNMRQQLLNKQGINRQGALDKMNVAAQDENNRMSQLGSLQTMQNQQADISAKNQQYGEDVQKFNIGNLMQDNQGRNAYNANVYNQAMQAWGANKSADAQAKAASSAGGGKK